MERLLNGLRAAAEPTRLRILALCAHAELTVTELTQILGQSQPRVSRHLKLLCDAGLLQRYREGTWAYYRLADRESSGRLARSLLDLIPVEDPDLALDLQRLGAVQEARARAAAEYFRANAGRWNEIRSLYVPEAEVEAALLRLAGREPIRDFLDVGTGTGRILQVFAPFVRRGIGIDLSHDMLRMARAQLEQAGCRHCQVRFGDMYALSLPPAAIDLAVIHQVLHYAENPAAVLAEAARVLRPGGRLLVVDFAKHDLDFLREEHRHRWLGFEPEKVPAWCRAAGLECGTPQILPGEPITVLIWEARRRGHAGARTGEAAMQEVLS